MPRKATDYSKTVIYVIKCKDDNITEEYIGSTTDFTKRKYQHKSNCYYEKGKSYNQLKYKFIRDNGGWDNWIMLEVEKYPCNDKREAEKREEEIRIDRKAKLNSHKAFGAETREEYQKLYREENKEELQKQNKLYREEHKKDKREYDKLYREEHKEELKNTKSIYCQTHKEDKREYDKLYRTQQEEKIKEYKKQYREANKDEINKRQREKYQLKKQQQMEETN